MMTALGVIHADDLSDGPLSQYLRRETSRPAFLAARTRHDFVPRHAHRAQTAQRTHRAQSPQFRSHSDVRRSEFPAQSNGTGFLYTAGEPQGSSCPTHVELPLSTPLLQAVACGKGAEPPRRVQISDIGRIGHVVSEARRLPRKVADIGMMRSLLPTRGRAHLLRRMIRCRFRISKPSSKVDPRAVPLEHRLGAKKLPVSVADALASMPSSAYHPESREKQGWLPGQLWGRVIELEVGGPIPRPQGEAAGASVRAVAATDRDRGLVRHWMPWLIPLLAIALPMLYFIVAASIPAAAWRWGEASTSVGRGDFLIPVLILCLEAMRRWWYEVNCGWTMGIVRITSSVLCLGSVVVCLDSFSVAASHVVTAHSTKSVAVITLGCFAVGFLSGTIAVWVSAPEAGRS